LIPFWEEADALGAILFIHPLLCDDPRLQGRRIANLIGIPWETTICATDLLLGGWMDRYPRVRILLAYGGGFLPYQIGRLQKDMKCGARWPPRCKPRQPTICAAFGSILFFGTAERCSC
jgi:Amidohydrolase